jgi:hypothetical protein
VVARAIAWAAAIVLIAAPPAAASGLTVTGTEGQQLSIMFSCSPTAPPPSVDWGDGTQTTNLACPSGTATATHTYAEEGGYNGTENGCTGTTNCSGGVESFTATIADAQLHASPASTIAAAAGQQFTGAVATFTDADPNGIASDYAATIDWGDGTQSTGTVTSAASGGFRVSGSHTYVNPGNPTVTVTISDTPSDRTSAQTDAVVSGVRAAFTPPPGPVPITHQLVLNASSSRPPGATVQSYGWSVNGRPVAACDGSTSMMSTRFNGPGTYTIGLRVTAGNGATTATQHAIVIQGGHLAGDIAPQARAGREPRPRVIETEQAYTCTRAAGDPVQRIVGLNALPSPGAGCQTQVFAGIAKATGCLTEHYEHVIVNASPITVHGISYTQYTLDTDPGQMPDVPKAEAQILLLQIARYYTFECNVQNPCPSVLGAQNYGVNLGGQGGNPPPLMQAGDVGGGQPRARAATVTPSQSQVITPCSSQAPQSGVSTTICLDLYVSSDPVNINGLNYRPIGGTVILFAPQFNLVIGSDAEIDVADLQAKAPAMLTEQLPDQSQDPANDTAIDFPNLEGLIAAEPDMQAQQQAMTEFGSVPDGPGFELDPNSDLKITFQDGIATVEFHVDLPPPFSGGTAGVYAQLSTSTQTIKVIYGYLAGGIGFGPVALNPFAICYRDHYSPDPSIDPCHQVTNISDNGSYAITGVDDSKYPDKTWIAVGVLKIGKLVTVDFAPLSKPVLPGCSEAVTPGLAFTTDQNGVHLDTAGAVLDFSQSQNGGIDLFPAVPGVIELTGLAASYDTSQAPNAMWTTFAGCFTLQFAQVLQLTGNVFVVETNNGDTYQFKGGELGTIGNGQNVLQKTGNPPAYPSTNHLAIGASAVASLRLPAIGSVPVAGAYGLYTDNPGAVYFGANFCLAFPSGDCNNPPFAGFTVNGYLNGAIGLQNPPPFDIDGGGGAAAYAFGAKVWGIQVMAVASWNNGQGGVGACGTLTEFGATASAHAGYHWGSNGVDIQFDPGDPNACTQEWINGYSVNVTAHDAAAGTVVHAPGGLSELLLNVHSATTVPPDVTVRGPGGSVVSTAGMPFNHIVKTPGFALLKLSAARETIVQPLHPRTGAYTVTANPGSAPIADISTSDGVVPAIRAHVAGSGIHRRLVYRMKPEPGQSVMFYEVSPQVHRLLGTATHATGSIPFTASTGSGSRQIIAEVLSNGSPQTREVVTTYRAPTITRLGKVRRVRLRRHRLTGGIAWSRVARASSYEIAIVLDHGVRMMFTTTRTRYSFAPLLEYVGGRITVHAVGDGVLTRDGPPATLRFKAEVKPPKLRRF